MIVKVYTTVILHPYLLRYTLSPQTQTPDPFSSPITAHIFVLRSLSFICPRAHSTSFCPQLEMLILAVAESRLLLDVASSGEGLLSLTAVIAILGFLTRQVL